jgi:hypothetical protein
VIKKFKLESDLRKWVREQAGDRPWWIEPSQGSTIGLPDCCVDYGARGRVVWVELKLAELRGISDRLKLDYDVRPAQRDVIGDMLFRGQSVSMLIGVKGSRMVLALKATQQSLSGRIDSMLDCYSRGDLRFCNVNTLRQGGSFGQRAGNVGLFEVALMMADGTFLPGGAASFQEEFRKELEK